MLNFAFRVITAHQTTLRLQKELEAPPGLQGDGSDLSKTPRTAREEDNVEEESSSQALNEKRKPVGTPKKGSVSAARKGPEVTKVAVAAVKGAFKLNVTIG